MTTKTDCSERVGLLPAFRTTFLLSTALFFLFPLLFSASRDDTASESRPAAIHLEEILPRETLAFFRCVGIDQLLTDCETHGLFKIWNEQEVRDFFADAKKMIPAFLEGPHGPPIPYAEAWSLLGGEIAVSWGSRPDLLFAGPLPAVTAALDMGKDRKAFKQKLSGLVEMVVRSGGLERESFEHRGVKVEKLSRPRNRLTICHAEIENLLVVTFDRPTIERIIDCRADASPSLASHPPFASCIDRIGKGDMRAMAFVDAKALMGVLSSVSPLDLKGYFEILGLDGIDAVCLTTSLEGDVSRDSLYFHCPGEKGGILKALSPHPITADNIVRTPSDSLFLLDTAIDTAMLMAEIENFVAKAFPDRAEAFRSELAGFNETIGLDLKREILEPLGDELCFFVNSPKGGLSLIPDFILTLSIRDAESYSAAQEKLLTMLQGELQVSESEFKGRVLRHVKLPMPQIPLSPTITTDGDRLIVAGTTVGMKRYLKWLDSESSGIGGNPSFGRIMADLPEDASMLFFVDLCRITGMAYDMGAPMLPSLLSRSEIPLDAGLLPMTETIVEHMENAAGYMVMDDEGILVTGRCPFGLSFFCSAFASLSGFLIEQDLIGSLVARGAAMESESLPAPERDPELGAAFMMMQDGDNGGAVRRFTAWLDRNQGPEWYRVWALTNRGECRMRMGRHADAVADFALVSELSSESRGRAFFQIARAFALMGEKEKAVEHVVKAAAAGHRFFDIHPDLASLRGESSFDAFIDMLIQATGMLRDGEDEIAAEIFTDWVYNNPYHDLSAWVMKSRGSCLIRLGYYQDGITDLEEAVRKDDSYGPEAYYDIACACAVLGDRDQAINYLEKAVQVGFEHLELLETDSDLDSLRDDARFEALKWRW